MSQAIAAAAHLVRPNDYGHVCPLWDTAPENAGGSDTEEGFAVIALVFLLENLRVATVFRGVLLKHTASDSKALMNVLASFIGAEMGPRTVEIIRVSQLLFLVYFVHFSSGYNLSDYLFFQVTKVNM